MDRESEVRTVRLASGVTLPYVIRGDPAETALVLLHAWGESPGSFDRLIPLLPADILVLAPDQRGHGQAGASPAGYALADLAADVVALLDHLGLASVVLLGSSSGGYVAQQVT